MALPLLLPRDVVARLNREHWERKRAERVREERLIQSLDGGWIDPMEQEARK